MTPHYTFKESLNRPVYTAFNHRKVAMSLAPALNLSLPFVDVFHCPFRCLSNTLSSKRRSMSATRCLGTPARSSRRTSVGRPFCCQRSAPGCLSSLSSLFSLPSPLLSLLSLLPSLASPLSAHLFAGPADTTKSDRRPHLAVRNMTIIAPIDTGAWDPQCNTSLQVQPMHPPSRPCPRPPPSSCREPVCCCYCYSCC